MKTKKELITAFVRENPDAASREIAEAVGASRDYVRHVLAEVRHCVWRTRTERLYEIFLAHKAEWIYDVDDDEREFLSEVHGLFHDD